MRTIGSQEAQRQFPRLLEEAASGSEIIIEQGGKPLAKIVPYREDEKPREPGYWRGRVRMADDFDELPEEIAAAFRGDS